jgi:hypothetical protein
MAASASPYCVLTNGCAVGAGSRAKHATLAASLADSTHDHLRN